MVVAYLAPIVDRTLMGAVPGWPPQRTTRAAFEQKVSVPATVSAESDANLVVHVMAVAPAEIKAVEVTYKSDGKHLRVRSTTSLAIRETCF